MSDSQFSVSKYVAEPKSVEISYFDTKAAECFEEFFSKWIVLDPLKRRAVKKSRLGLVNGGFLEDFSVHFTAKLKTEAYMNDSGDVYLSLGLLAGRSALTVLSVYCHELSHIKLSQHGKYAEIKAMQREFKQRFGDRKGCELMSPIEFYAMLISRKLLFDIAESTNNKKQVIKIKQLITDLDEKIELLSEEIVKLQEI